MKKEQIHYLSYIRALACIAIVVLHTVNAAEIIFRESISETEQTVSLAVVNLLMWAVPCFVMVTGALLLDRNRILSLRIIFTRYIARILIVLFTCGIVFNLFDDAMNGNGVSIRTFAVGFQKILTGQSWAHLWYLYLLIGLYLLMPFYRMAANGATRREFRYLLLIQFLFLSVFPILRIWGVTIGFYLHVMTIYPFYLFLGYGLHCKILKWRRRTGMICMAGAILLSVGSTVMRWGYGKTEFDGLLSYYSLPVVLLSAVIFSFFSSEQGERSVRTPIGNWLRALDQRSFGIYLIHLIWIRLIFRYWHFNPYTHGGIAAFLIICIIVLAVSYGMTWILQKIPGFRRYL